MKGKKLAFPQHASFHLVNYTEPNSKIKSTYIWLPFAEFDISCNLFPVETAEGISL